MRLDALVAAQLNTTRSHAKQLIQARKVQAKGIVVTKPSQDISEDISLTIDDRAEQQPVLQLETVYDDPDIMVVVKPAGVLAHPTSMHQQEATVVDSIQSFTTDDDLVRPGIVHRLDRNTSGLMVIAKTKAAKSYMQQQFRNRLVEKTYTALVIGHLKQEEAVIRVPLARSKSHPLKRVADPAGKSAETSYRVIEHIGNYDLVEAKPQTGRTHQLRAHFAHLGHPIVGDKLYGASVMLPSARYFLHAGRLEFIAPSGTSVEAQAALPLDLETFLQKIRRHV
jgi:23S rRNA pseudouridine1911/1915/1917 synthase